MEQTNEQPIESVQSSKNIWITVIAVIATALIVGGGVYTWQKSILKNTEQKLQQQILVLQNQISQLQQAQTNQNQQANQPAIEHKQNTPAVTMDDKQNEPTSQPADPTADWKTYQNNTYGYEFKYPTNWFDPIATTPQQIRVSYLNNSSPKSRVLLGPNTGTPCEGPDCYLFYIDNFQALNFEQVVQNLHNAQMIDVNKTEVINGLSVIIYKEQGMKIYRNALIFGESQTMLLSFFDDSRWNSDFDKILTTFNIR